jgi:carbon-monoxide dehydrogenase medium subunit
MVLANGEGTRTVPAADFFTGTWTTATQPEELLVAARFPIWPAGSRFAVEEVARRRGDFAIAGTALGIRVSDAVVVQAAVALFGMASTPLRSSRAEAALVGTAIGDIDGAEIGRLAVEGMDPPDDLHASRDLRLRIGATVVSRALRRALEEAEVA